ncbi:MAG: Asp-tRNA(Asn)/Glu-tRNA(Gln) amidotransferase subunit GatA [Bacteroidota bacterium]|nr:Asp-tRNA(Asn)/Glu-tRNA(Gln) amidotransferase subunit GatA [Bacteroidota bacterium]
MTKYRSLAQISTEISAGKLSCEILVSQYLKTIQAKNTSLNVFLDVYGDEALARAKEIDQKIKSGTAGKLAGMVVGIKDVLSYQNHGLQAASKILDKFVAQYNATAVQRLIDADAIIIGRQNCDEFAMGSSNEKSAFGPVKNEIGENRVPGGSSGGSAVAVQADMCLVSLGSDTGGSVRQPASFCGIIGLKPTYSRISRWGLIAYASSFDCIGIFGHSVEDVALVLEVIAGADEKDSTVSQKPVPNYVSNLKENKKYKIAYLEEGITNESVQLDTRNAVKAELEKIKSLGHSIHPVHLPLLKYSVPSYYILTTAEASSNLSRYDGVKFGMRSAATTDLMSMYKKTRAEGFGKEVKKRIMLGSFVLSASYYDAYYTKAQKIRRLIKNEFDEIFKNHDLLVMPTSPITAFKIGELTNDPMAMYLADIFTVSANIIGAPGISIPIGKDSEGLPIGLQIMAPDFKEEELLKFSYQLSE